MKNLILLLVLPFLLLSCDNTGEKNILSKSSDWTFTNNAQIKDSVLLLSGNESVAGYNEEYKNFELELECNTSHGAIAGIWFHTNSSQPSSKGYEVLINNNIDK